jgi:hypothetical protein
MFSGSNVVLSNRCFLALYFLDFSTVFCCGKKQSRKVARFFSSTHGIRSNVQIGKRFDKVEHLIKYSEM